MSATQAPQQLETLTVETGEDRYRTEQFRGYWVVKPSDDMRSGAEGADAGTCFGVAHTAKGKVAVYRYHVNDRWPASLDVYDDIDDAGLPNDIVDEYRDNLGDVIVRDI